MIGQCARCYLASGSIPWHRWAAAEHQQTPAERGLLMWYLELVLLQRVGRALFPPLFANRTKGAVHITWIRSGQ